MAVIWNGRERVGVEPLNSTPGAEEGSLQSDTGI
jgi:hypothetical protein